MALDIPVGFAQLAMVHRMVGDAEEMICTFGVRMSDQPFDSTSLTDIGNLWNSTIMQQVHTTVELVAVRSVEGPRPDGATQEVAFVGKNGGISTGSTVPQNTGFLIRKITARGGRAHRGRMFIPGVPEASVGPTGIVDPTVLASLQTQATAFRTNLDALGEQVNAMAVLHNAPLVGPTPTPTDITALVADPRVATQRRRLRP